MASEDYNKYHLEELSGSDFEIADNEPDIQGWDVKNEQGQRIGEVDDLLFDPDTRKVRYLVVDLDDNELDVDDDKKVLIPIGVAELYGSGTENDPDDDDEDYDEDDEEYQDDDLDEDDTELADGEDDLTGVERHPDAIMDDKHGYRDNTDDTLYNPQDDGNVVIVPVSVSQLEALPSYEKDKVTPETEVAIRDIFAGAGAAAAVTPAAYNRNEFYDHDHFNEDRFYNRRAGTETTDGTLPVIEENLQVGKREVETGGARITSRVVQQPVEERVNLREEHVNVERTPVNRPISGEAGADAFKEQNIELTEHAEVPVVSKETRVVEEVSLSKDVEEREETIKDTLRNTEVEARRLDPDDRDQYNR